MQPNGFTESLDQVVAEDPRFDREAYLFLRDALDHTIKMQKRQHKTEPSRHVNGRELLEGVRQYALKQFGPMVPTVFHYWGITKTEHFGEMVFNLVRVKIFGKTDADSIEDFRNVYTFQDAFVAPFLPTPAARPKSSGEPAREIQ